MEWRRDLRAGKKEKNCRFKWGTCLCWCGVNKVGWVEYDSYFDERNNCKMVKYFEWKMWRCGIWRGQERIIRKQIIGLGCAEDWEVQTKRGYVLGWGQSKGSDFVTIVPQHTCHQSAAAAAEQQVWQNSIGTQAKPSHHLLCTHLSSNHFIILF